MPPHWWQFQAQKVARNLEELQAAERTPNNPVSYYDPMGLSLEWWDFVGKIKKCSDLADKPAHAQIQFTLPDGTAVVASAQMPVDFLLTLINGLRASTY